MTEREELVRVRVKGGGAASFAAGQKYALQIAAGATAGKWADGSPITRAEAESVLPQDVFEIDPPHGGGSKAVAPAAPAARPRQTAREE